MYILSRKKSLCYLKSDHTLRLVYVQLADVFNWEKNCAFYLCFVFQGS